MARAVQDQALAEGASAAVVAVYGGLVATVDHLLGGDGEVDRVPDDAVLQAAISEVPAETVAWMGDWLISNWTWIVNAGDVLASLDELEDLFPIASSAELAYRDAAQELAHRNGEPTAAVAYAGAQAQARWLRLYGGRVLDSLHELAVADVALEAARRELTASEKTRVSDWVHSVNVWEQIDELATERAS